MVNTFTPISAVSGGKKNLKLILCVAHIWCSYDKSNPNEVTFMNTRTSTRAPHGSLS